MNYFRKIIGHTRNIIVHKWWVFYYACKFRIPWRGFLHDWSKFSPVEFWESVKYFKGDSSPIPECKKDKGYSLAWQHHKGRNPHHYEYWIDYLDDGGIPIRIPYIYSVEMICDYLAAGRTYKGKSFTFKDELDWWKIKRPIVKMDESSKLFIDKVFNILAENGNISSSMIRYIYEIDIPLELKYNK